MRIILKKVSLFFLALFVFNIIHAQGVKGKVTDKSGQPISGATVSATASAATTTDADGNYTLTLQEGSYQITYSFVGYEPQTLKIAVAAGFTDQNVILELSSTSLGEIIVTGTRALGRSKLASLSPVDVIPVAQVTNNIGQVDLNQILNYIAPSFQSSRQTVTDGSDHIDPAQLRGMGADQVLVLVNGKRRHQTALVNVNGTVNKGTVSTDLNSIPASSVERIEILRDGAAAQYGSDAIAGVINVIIKKNTGLTGSVSYGSNVTEYEKGYFANKALGTNNGKASVTDGGTFQAGLNYGTKLLKKGYVNLTAEFTQRDASNRAGTYYGQIYPYTAGGTPTSQQIIDNDNAILASNGLTRSDFDLRFGNAKVKGIGTFVNAALPVNDQVEAYLFGGYSSKHGEAGGFYRYPNAVPSAIRSNVLQVYPNGFLPLIESDVQDFSLAGGFRGNLAGWNYDLSFTHGQNSFGFTVSNSANYTQTITSATFPTTFDAGQLRFAQNTINFDVNRRFDVLSGLNFAWGGESRVETFAVTAGEESSYRNYSPTSGITGGAQVFAGFQPTNAGKNSRSSYAAYIDLEQDFTEAFTVGAALRFENYTDFGSTLNYKLAARYKITDNIALRGAISTGFRAPSLQQRYYAKTNTLVNNGVFYEAGTFTNDSKLAQGFGIPTLKEETSQNFSVGTTAKIAKGLELTVDAFSIKVDNRIILTNLFSANGNTYLDSILKANNANSANFFANAINTKTRGIEAVLSYNTNFGIHALRLTASGAFLKNEVEKNDDGSVRINATPILVESGQLGNYFNRADQSRIELGTPQNKVTFIADYKVKKFSVFLRATNFGRVTSWSTVTTPSLNIISGAQETLDQTFTSKLVTDLAVSYDIITNLKFTLGANNLLDIYPDKFNHSGNSSSGRFVYPNLVQQHGFNGRYVFGRLSFKL